MNKIYLDLDLSPFFPLWQIVYLGLVLQRLKNFKCTVNVYMSLVARSAMFTKLWLGSNQDRISCVGGIILLDNLT